MIRIYGISIVAISLLLASSVAAADEDAPKAEPEALKAVTAKIEQLEEKTANADELMSRATEQLEDKSKTAGSGQVDPNLKAYLDYKQKANREKAMYGGEGDNPVEFLIPIAFFAMVVLMVFIPLYLRNRRRMVEAEVQRKAIEAGLQFIPEIPSPPKQQYNDRRTGLLLAGLGIAAAVPVALFGYPRYAVFGLAFVFLGIAYFLAGKYLSIESDK